MSEGRGPRDDAAASHKGGVAESQGVSEMVKVKHQPMFATPKYDGYGDSLAAANLSDVKFSFTEGGMSEGNRFMPPSIPGLNESSELQEFSFLNLTGVSPAEQDILHTIIHDSKWYSESLFCLMRASPTPPGGPSVEIDTSERCLTDRVEDDGIPEVSAAGDSDGSVGGHLADEVPLLQNGPVVDLNQPHMNPVDEGNMPGVMTSGVPPSNMRPYYPNPNQPHMAVSTTGPAPTSVQLPVSGPGGMMMYNHQQIQQLMQPGHGGYPQMPIAYPSVHYGFAQHGGQPHVTYVSPTGDAVNHESVHMGPPPQQAHQKPHHDGHHGMSHTSASSGPVSYSKGGRNPRRDNVKQQQQQQQQQQQPSYYYQTGYGYPPGMHYHHSHHQQLAQNVTGSPIIMQPAHGVYPQYHQHPQSMYPPNSAVPGEMEHHQPNVGMPPQPMTHISGEIPPYAQHHHVSPMYHHSPTHGGGGSNRTANYSQSRGAGTNPIPSAPLEHPINNPSAPNSAVDIHSEVETVVSIDGVKTSEGDISQSTVIASGHHHHPPPSHPHHHHSPGGGDRGDIIISNKRESEYNSQQQQQSLKKSFIPGGGGAVPLQDISMQQQLASSTGGPSPHDISSLHHQQQPGPGIMLAENNFESLSEPSRDTEVVVDRIAPPPTNENKLSSAKGAAGGRVNRNNNNHSSQHKGTSSSSENITDNSEIVVTYNKETPSVNGEVKDIKSGRGGVPPRDKLSAEPVAATDATNNNVRKDFNETEVARQSSGNLTSGKQPADTTKSNNRSNVSANVSSNGSLRSVNVVSNTSIVTTASSSSSTISSSSLNKDITGKIGGESSTVSGSGGDFPQLSTNCNSIHAPASSSSLTTASSNNSSSINVSSAGSTTNAGGATATAQQRGRSWASIASVKSQSGDGANSNSRRILPPGASIHQGIDQGSGDAIITEVGRLAGGEQYSNFVPSSQNDRSLAKSLGESDLSVDAIGFSDENNPVALALGEFLNNYKLDHHSIALTPRGLYNQSNYCYINATLQSLLACPPFVNMFRAMGDILNKRHCRATPIIQSVFEFVSEFEPLLRGNANKKDRMKDAFHVGANLEPLGIRKCLGLLEGNTFKVEGRQEDAEEFLSHLLNGLHDEMLKVMKLAEQHKERSTGKSKPVPPANNPPPSNKMAAAAPAVGQGATNGGGVELIGDEDDDQWQVMGAKNKSCLTRKTTVCKTPISEAFLGQMCYFYRESSTGSNKSATHQPFYTLQLDIQNDNIRSVRDALEAIVAREEVSGVVSANGAEVEAWRQLSLEELPVVLILHLKRFVYEQKSNKIKKIDKKLDFGIDLEIFKEMLSPNAKSKYNARQRQYKLFGVVYHDGEETHKGHYIADCFHASGGSMWGQCGWLRFDDTSVKQIPESQMLNPLPPRVPYLLYYRRGDTLLSHVTQQQQHNKKDRP